MSLVPFRVSGAAASQQLNSQLLQVGPHSLLLLQRPQQSGVTAHLTREIGDQQQQQQQQEVNQGPKHQSDQGRLHNVGFSIWQSGFVLADFLLLRFPQLQADRTAAVAGSVIRSGTSRSITSSSGNDSYWCGVRVLELGCGAGTVGMFLALAGAQVVSTDQQHIVPFTLENLQINFPATAVNSTAQQDQVTGMFGQRGQMITTTTTTTAAATTARGTCEGASTAESANAAIAAGTGVCTSSPANGALAAADDAVSAATGRYTLQQQKQQQQQPALQHVSSWHVFQSGPLVVQYTWGEPLQQLQDRVAQAAAEKCSHISNKLSKQAAPKLAAAGSDCFMTQQVLQDVVAGGCYDVVVGADLVYDPAGHQALLDSLNEVCAPHTQVFLCHRNRGLGEEQFEELAATAGWLVQVASGHLLHPEFQDGHYKLLCLSKLG